MARDTEILDEARWRTIRDAVDASGLSLGELGERAGVDKSTLSRILNRKQNFVTRRVLRAVAGALDELGEEDVIEQIEFVLDDEAIEGAKTSLEQQLLEIRREMGDRPVGIGATGIVRVQLRQSARAERVYQRSFGLPRRVRRTTRGGSSVELSEQ